MKSLLKIQPKVITVENIQVYCHPKLTRVVNGWNFDNHCIFDKDFNSNWKESLKRCHILIGQQENNILDANILNALIDIPTREIDCKGYCIHIFRNISRKNDTWVVERRHKGERKCKYFADSRFNYNWKKALLTAVEKLLKMLGIFNEGKDVTVYPAISCFKFKGGLMRFWIKTKCKKLVRYIQESELTQQTLDDISKQLYQDWVCYHSMARNLEDKYIQSFTFPADTSHWYRPDFPKLRLDAIN